ncbi:MAG: hypothetical protein JSV04_14370 [Candidatus Heimdallarchaeota archaeon]|nr:MAG: hypothetical protein JSV04_14370 [Candidatus Heimdallarchaeota archaeon]
MPLYRDLEEKINKIPTPRPNKLLDLPSAIEQTLTSIVGKKLHFSCVSALPYSAIREIIRLSKGRDHQFEVISLGSASQIQMLVAQGLVSKLTTSYVGDVYPRPGISPVFQRAVDEGLEIEQWSLMALCLRLYAGALGLNFIPTSSILGSTMASDNKKSFTVIPNPFDSTQRVAIIKELIPDMSFFHAWVADPLGNALIFPPYSENLWGCFASKRVILTTEKIVDTARIRELANTNQCLTLPGGIVESVSESPFGGHPGSHYGPNGVGYDIDLDFLVSFREAAKESEKISSWMEEWIYSTDSESYLQKLGTSRLTANRGRLDKAYWKWLVAEKEHMIKSDFPATPIESMIWSATELIKKRVKESDYSTILAGQGASNLAAWLAAYSLHEDGHNVNLLAEVGFYGYLPKPASPYIFEYNNVYSSTTIVDSIMALGAILQSTKSIGVLGAGQIDHHGNINSTRIENFILFGSGGANDVGVKAEIIVLLPLKPGRFPEEVSYITVPGTNVTTCITTEAIFEKKNGRLVLSGYTGDSTNEDQIVGHIKEIVGWDLEINHPLVHFEPPSSTWLQFLRSFDPNRFFLGRLEP